MEKIYRRGPEHAPRKLTLNDHGLRYEIGSQNYSLGWDGFHHRIEVLRSDGAVRSVILVTRDGKWFALGAFEDMAGIAATVRQHVQISGPQNIWEKLQFNPWFVPINLVLGFLGMWLIYEKAPVLGLLREQQALIGCVLLVPVGVVTLYSLPRNPLMWLSMATRRPGNAVYRFFTNLAVWVAIMLAVLFVLNFVVPRLR